MKSSVSDEINTALKRNCMKINKNISFIAKFSTELMIL